MKSSVNRLIFGFLLVAGVAACDDNPVDEGGEPIDATLVENLPADPQIETDPITGRPVGTGRYTFYSLREGRIVAGSDSATTNWDLAFNATTILTNGGSSGPGQGGGAVVASAFEAVTEVASEVEILEDEPGAPALARAGVGAWYNYNPQTHQVTPVPGRTLVIRTADGRFAKVRILSYYRDAPDPVRENSESRYYTFEYVFQPDGSRSLRAQ